MTWELIVHINNELKKLKSTVNYVSVNIYGESFELFFDEIDENTSIVIDFLGSEFNVPVHIVILEPFSIEYIKNSIYTDDELNFVSSYLPYAVLPYFSRKEQKCYSIAHFAQTLDGKIATSSGDSKWIGNKENLIHAHKMRALCDGIMIGAKTLVNDNPKLNVRLVDGSDPTKVVVGGDDLDLGDYIAIDNDTIIFSQNHKDLRGDDRLVALSKSKNHYKPGDLLEALYNRGLHSVYIEGGSFTTSLFLKYRLIDQVQVHITPKIMGSGITGFQFEGSDSVQDAIEFKSFRFIPVGNQIMFVGELEANGKL